MSNRHHVVYETRSKRERRSALMKLGVWIFLAIFVFSVAGGVVLFGGFGKP